MKLVFLNTKCFCTDVPVQEVHVAVEASSTQILGTVISFPYLPLLHSFSFLLVVYFSISQLILFFFLIFIFILFTSSQFSQ